MQNDSIQTILKNLAAETAEEVRENYLELFQQNAVSIAEASKQAGGIKSCAMVATDMKGITRRYKSDN